MFVTLAGVMYMWNIVCACWAGQVVGVVVVSDVAGGGGGRGRDRDGSILSVWVIDRCRRSHCYRHRHRATVADTAAAATVAQSSVVSAMRLWSRSIAGQVRFVCLEDGWAQVHDVSVGGTAEGIEGWWKTMVEGGVGWETHYMYRSLFRCHRGFWGVSIRGHKARSRLAFDGHGEKSNLLYNIYVHNYKSMKYEYKKKK